VVPTPAPDLLELVVRVVKRSSDSADAATDGSERADERSRESGPGLRRHLLDWLSWWLHVPDSSTGWFLPAVWAGLRQARRCRPDVIFSTAPRWTSHLVAAALSGLLNLPWVADFRDPWVGSHFRAMPYAVHRKFDALLEKIVVRRADRITCAWDGIRRHLLKRYPRRQGDITTILNGFDPRQIDRIKPVRLDEDRCVLLHAGTFYGPRSPAPLLEGLRRLSAECPNKAARLLVVFLGMPAYNDRPLAKMVAERGLTGLVSVMPRVSQREALALMKGCDVALLFGQSGSASLASVPAKTYDYVGAGKPVLVIGAGEEACKVIRRGGCQLWRVEEADRVGMASALRRIASDYGRYRLMGQQNQEARQAFTRARMAERLMCVLEEAIESRAP